jgi:uncharacterized repeat protein (TIGR02543 family)
MKSRIFIGFILLIFIKSLTAQETELLTNPDFTDGTNGWWAYGANISTNNGEVIFDIGNAGENPWDIQLGQGELTLKQGYKYTLCWRAKRESGTLGFNVGLGAAPYTLYFYDNSKNYDGNWQESCYVYTHQDEDVSNVALTVNMGGIDANATFDYIRLVEEPLPPAEKVKITFQVDMQNQTVADNGIFITGSFINWSAPVKMQSNGSIYSVVLELEKGSSVEYKFINGDTYESIDGNCTVSDYKNRIFIVPNSDKSVDLVCFNSCNACTDATILNTNPGPGPVSYYGEMQVDGNRIYGARTGTPVQVKGMSLFTSLWRGEKFWNSGTINTLVDDWDIELIRAPIAVEENYYWDYGFLNPYGREKQLRFVDEVVKAAIARDIYVLIDYHSFEADEHPEAAIEFFSNVAQKYGEYNNVIFEIYNEPVDVSWAEIKLYAEQITDVIRQYSDNLIVVGTERWSSKVEVASLSPLDDDNTAYTYHFYSVPDMHNPQEGAIKALENGIALFATEWGNIYTWGENLNNSDEVSFANSDTLHMILDQNSISSANWTVFVEKDNPTGSSLFNHVDGLQGNVSFTGKNWDDQSLWTTSAHYVYDMFKEQAATALWRKAEKQGFSITYHLNEGYNGANPTFYSFNLTDKIELDKATREGFQFDGWFDNSDLSGTPIDQIDAGSNGNLELFAKWSEPTEVELLEFPDFSLGTYGWAHHGNDSVTVENDFIIIHEPTDNSANIWDYNFINYEQFQLKEGHRYTLSWRAMRTAGNIRFEARKIGTYDYFMSDDYEFNGEWQNNTVVYDHTDATITDLELMVMVGGNSSDVTFDYVSLKETLIPEPETYTITTEVTPTNAGTVSDGGTYTEEEIVQLTASASEDFEFVNWTENGTVVSTNPDYSFTVSQSRTLVANFENTVGVFDQIDDLNIHIYPNCKTDHR